MKQCFLCLAALVLCTMTSCGNDKYQKAVGRVFGTYYAVTYSSDKDLSEEMEKAMAKINASLSTFDSLSVISRINRNDTSVITDRHFETVFAKACEVSEKTGGAFDLTVAPLVNAWGFGYKPSDTHRQSQIDSIMQFVGSNKVHLLPTHKVKKDDDRLLLDASAIAKGYASDVVAACLDSFGVQNYIVDIGGELVMKGKNPRGEKWRIGISKPVDNVTNDVERIIALSDCAIATSGNYRQFYETEDGQRVSHTIDPRSGYPALNPLLSASVIAKDCMTADAYATAFMVLGDTVQIRKIADECEDIYGWYAILKGDDGRHVEACSDNFKTLVVSTSEN